jgi:uncharacterized protein YdeI (YjbR/CyaY-like superfamily)
MPQRHFSGRAAWRAWLKKNHATSPGLWLVFYKPGKGITYEEAVEEALCYGWIDSLIKRLDADRYLRKFTPRTNTGHWSAINLQRIRRLQREGRMTTAGLAKLDKGVQAYVPLAKRRIAVPPDLRRALAGNPRARENFARLAPSYRRHYVAWIATAKKAETRVRRLRIALALLAKDRKLGMK